MIKSLYSGVTGLKTHTQRMDVIGNNIANVNTTAYKAGTVTFKDVYYQTKQSASGGDYTQGGINPKQVGYGVQLGTISKVMTQSGLTYSDSVFDCALEGSGFFQVMDSAGKIYYTRLGRFSLDDFGNLCDPNGNVVLGVSGDPTNVAANSQRINLHIPDIDDSYASAVKEYKGNEIQFTAAQYGPGGNVAISIIPSDSPFATMTGSVLNVYMDLSKDYEKNAREALSLPATGVLTTTEQQALAKEISARFSEDLRDAIRLGGVNVDPAIFELITNPTTGAETTSGVEISFGSLPDITAAVRAKNTITLFSSTTGAVTTNYNIDLEMVKPGAFGNKYEINFKNDLTAGDKPIARWVDNVLTIRLPSDGSFTQEDIQTAVDEATGVEAAQRTAIDAALAAGTELPPDIPQKAITVTLSKKTGSTVTPITGTDPFAATSAAVTAAQATLTSAIADVTTAKTALDADPGNTALQTAYNNAVTARETAQTAYNAAVAASDMGKFQTALDGRIRKVAMGSGTNSYFQEAFSNLATVRLDGGYFQTPQDASTCEITIDRDGVIYGKHPIHGMLLLGRIDVVDFVNPDGLNQSGTSYYTESLASGPPMVRIPSEESETFIIASALEMSNVDLSQEFSDMIITQRGFQANSRIITVSDTMLEELINLKR